LVQKSPNRCKIGAKVGEYVDILDHPGNFTSSLIVVERKAEKTQKLPYSGQKALNSKEA